MKNEQIIGAFSVSMPKYRLTDETKEQIISALKQKQKRNRAKNSKIMKKRLQFSFLPYNMGIDFQVIK